MVVIVLCAGCGADDNNKDRSFNKTGDVKSVLEEGMSSQSADEPSGSATEPEVIQGSEPTDIPGSEPEVVLGAEPDGVQQKSEDGIDVDLTVLSSTMVYSEVYNMMCSPDDYLGKTMKMDGVYSVYHDETTDKYYHACIITDATACCAQGIEFELTDDYAYPDDYPREGETICVTGTFDKYQEGENWYYTLKNAELEVSS